MRLNIDTDKNTLSLQNKGVDTQYELYSKEAFEIISALWSKAAWNAKYTYTFSWMGRPIIQLPQDIIRVQEVIYRVKPDVIIETGVAHGGSIIFYASLCKAMGKGRVIGIDIEIRPHNRSAIETHELFPYVTLIEGGSTDPATVAAVRGQIQPDEKVFVLLDSSHTKEHVIRELESYSEFVTSGSYIVVTDGVMKYLWDVPRGNRDWAWNNPVEAAAEFLVSNPDFVSEDPVWSFNESNLTDNISHWPFGWLKRK